MTSIVEELQEQVTTMAAREIELLNRISGLERELATRGPREQTAREIGLTAHTAGMERKMRELSEMNANLFEAIKILEERDREPDVDMLVRIAKRLRKADQEGEA